MRGVKFRGYLKKKGRMLPVASLNFNGVDPYDVFLTSCGDLSCGMCEDPYKLDEVEIMQYTGLRDASGVEIYEGDILGREKDDTESRVSHHIVEWHDTGFMGRQVCSYSSYIGLDVWTQHKDGYVVLGNIYENPELLQEVTK